jgi:hypothetical protein
METKTCSKCGETKPLSKFKKKKHCRDGREGRCQKCADKASAASRQRFEIENADRLKDARKKRSTRWISQNPEARRAQKSIELAIARGDLPKAKQRACIKCGKPAAHYHHYLGYEPEHWLDVIPVCHSCHRVLHQSNDQ